MQSKNTHSQKAEEGLGVEEGLGGGGGAVVEGWGAQGGRTEPKTGCWLQNVENVEVFPSAGFIYLTSSLDSYVQSVRTVVDRDTMVVCGLQIRLVSCCFCCCCLALFSFFFLFFFNIKFRFADTCCPHDNCKISLILLT